MKLTKDEMEFPVQFKGGPGSGVVGHRTTHSNTLQYRAAAHDADQFSQLARQTGKREDHITAEGLHMVAADAATASGDQEARMRHANAASHHGNIAHPISKNAATWKAEADALSKRASEATKKAGGSRGSMEHHSTAVDIHREAASVQRRLAGALHVAGDFEGFKKATAQAAHHDAAAARHTTSAVRAATSHYTPAGSLKPGVRRDMMRR